MAKAVVKSKKTVKRAPRKIKKNTKGKLLLIFGVLALLILPVAVFIASQKTDTKSNAATTTTYLTRNGTQLMLNGKPYKFTGFDVFGFEGCEGLWYGDADYDRYFSSLQPYSMTRTDAFQPWGFDRLDAMVASAERNNQLLILMLADGRSQCNEYDGAPNGNGSSKTTAWYQGGYKTNYIPWVKQIVSRYKDSKAIGMWEILNEAGNDDASDTVIKAFFDDTAATIKAIDPNHLVESGSQATYIQGTSDYAYVHGGPNIDVASLHEYDYDYNNSNVIESGWFQPALDQMNSINKPLIIGESGVNGADKNCRTTLAKRSDVFRQKFDTYLNKGAAGVLVWNWSQGNYTAECNWWVGPNDPLMAMMRTYPYPGMPVATGSAITTTPTLPTNTPVVQLPTSTPVPATNTPRPTSIPVQPTSTPVPATGGNMLRNGSFDQGLSPWNLSVNTPARGTLSSDASSKIDGNVAAKVDITKKGSAYWNVQLRQDTIAITAGKKYTLTFWARASKKTTIDAAVQQAISPYAIYTQPTISLTTSWQKYTTTFTAGSSTTNALAGFYLGNTAVATVWIDNVALISN